MKRAASISLIVISLTGCAILPEAHVSEKPLQVGWLKNEWRTCAGEECPSPTPKTVILVPPRPVVPAPAPKVAEKPPVERVPIVVRFEFARAKPTKDGMEALQNAASSIRPGDILHIEGHTDDRGGQGYNDRLARSRAQFVAAWLKKRDIKNPLEIEAHGKCCYVVPNDSEGQRALNRRVEIRFANHSHKEK